MRKKPTRKRPYFTMESAMTAILRDASGKMHHGILFDRRLSLLVCSCGFNLLTMIAYIQFHFITLAEPPGRTC